MMNNEDNDITLSNDKDISLMEGVRIKTADPSSDEPADTLRWYIYKEATIEGEGAEAEPTAEAEAAAEEVAETPAVEETATAAAAATAAVAEEAVNETATEAKEAVKETAAETEAAAKEAVNETAEAAGEAVNETAEAAKEAAPGFESIFAITGLLAVAYLVLGRRE